MKTTVTTKLCVFFTMGGARARSPHLSRVSHCLTLAQSGGDVVMLRIILLRIVSVLPAPSGAVRRSWRPAWVPCAVIPALSDLMRLDDGSRAYH